MPIKCVYPEFPFASSVIVKTSVFRITLVAPDCAYTPYDPDWCFLTTVIAELDKFRLAPFATLNPVLFLSSTVFTVMEILSAVKLPLIIMIP